MKKEKKIGFNYSLYKTKRPEKNKKGIEIHPIYVNVSYQRKGTKIPLVLGMGVMKKLKKEFTEQEFETVFPNSEYKKRIEFILEKIIRFEAGKVGENYKVKGLKSRFDNYASSLLDIFEIELEDKLINFLGDHYSYNEFSKQEELYNELWEEGNENSILSNSDFFRRYYHYDILDFKIINKLSEEKKKKITAFIILSLFENQSSNHNETVGEYTSLFDWIILKDAKLKLKEFMLSELKPKSINQLTNQDMIIFKQFKDEVLNISFQEVQLILNAVIKKSSYTNEIQQSLG